MRRRVGRHKGGVYGGRRHFIFVRKVGWLRVRHALCTQVADPEEDKFVSTDSQSLPSQEPDALEALRASRHDPLAYLVRHVADDWGDVEAHDRYESEISVERCCWILSSYTLSVRTRFWVITEADRRDKTLLLPIKY